MSERGESHPNSGEELLVETDSALEALTARILENPGHPCAVDTEADSLHSYREKLCLIQMAWQDCLAVIDPLKISSETQARFVSALGKCEVWFHGADFDMTILLRTYDQLPQRILDTQLAARLVGEEKFGLANLIEQYFDIRLSKSSQKADWGKRPLGEKMLQYAYDDVRYLLQLADQLSERLRELERWDWFEEWCELSRSNVFQRKERPIEDAWRVPGWGKLDRRALCFLRAIWMWRDQESERRDSPPFKVMNNSLMLHLAERAAQGGTVRGAKGLGGDESSRLRQAVEEAAKVPQQEWPPKRLRRGGPRVEFDPAVYQRLRDVRDRAADGLKVDPTIIATRGVLEALALDESKADELLMTWQRGLIFPGN